MSLLSRVVENRRFPLARLRRSVEPLRRFCEASLIRYFAARSSDFSPTLAILEDDLGWPFWRSPFRLREYHAILRAIPGAAIYSTWLGEGDKNRPPEWEGFLRERPVFAGRILPISRTGEPEPDSSVRLAYIVFLNNAFQFVALLERRRIPFCLEMYPGGGFHPGQQESDDKVERLVTLPGFRRAIVTQPITQDFLLNRGYCQPAQLEYIYGGVLAEPGDPAALPRRRFGQDKDTIDICFVAHRYTPRGEDKGYDLFLEAVQLLLPRFPALRCHVVGDFNEQTIPLAPATASRFRFYGVQPSSFLPGFFAGMDAIVSPNRPFVLRPGAFDGFPTGCCIEAGLCGTAVVCTDPLRLNRHYGDGEEIILVEDKSDALAARLEQFLGAPEKLRCIGERGRQIFRQLFAPEAQLKPRLRLLEREHAACLPLPRERRPGPFSLWGKRHS